jgi:hypothetical protein
MTLKEAYADGLPNPLPDEEKLRRDFGWAEALVAEHEGTAVAGQWTVVRDRIAQALRMLTPGLNGPLR